MVVQADAGLAQHAEEALFSAVVGVIVAADVGDPAGGAAQRRLGVALLGEQCGCPIGQRLGKAQVASEIGGEVAGSGRQGLLAPHVLVQKPGIPALAQAVGGEDHARRAGGAQQAAQHHGGERQVGQALDRGARHAFQRAPRRCRDHAGEVARFFPLQAVVMHDEQRVGGLRDVHPGQGAEGAADQVQVAALSLF